MLAVALTALAFAGWQSVNFYRDLHRKVAYCRGSAENHRRLAEYYREVAASPGCSPEEAAGHRWIARKEDLIASKYQAIVDDPSKPYPGVPFFSASELEELGPTPIRK